MPTTLSSAIEDSGLDAAWSEADIYDPTTTRQILEAKHMKITFETHENTVQVLHDLYVEGFFREQLNKLTRAAYRTYNRIC